MELLATCVRITSKPVLKMGVGGRVEGVVNIMALHAVHC